MCVRDIPGDPTINRRLRLCSNRSRHFSVGIFLFLVLFAGTCFSAEIKFPSPAGYVNDFADMIDASSEAKLSSMASSLKKKTGCEMAIVTVKTTEPLDPKTYAVKLNEKWKVGEKGKDNGYIILVAEKERRTEIEVGYGLEYIMTDSFCGRVLDEAVTPMFKAGKYGEGLAGGAAMINRKISENMKDVGKPAPKKKNFALGLVLLSFLLIVIIVISVLIGIFDKSKKVSGAVFSSLVGAVIGYIFAAGVGAFIGAIIGLIASQNPGAGRGMWTGGGFGGGSFGGGFGGGSSGGGFGGFGGGGSGGGGAGRSW